MAENNNDLFNKVKVTTNVVTKSVGVKNSIYRFYDQNGNEIAQNQVSSEAQKNLRNKLRKELVAYANKILFAYKSKNVSVLAEQVQSFIAWSRKNYVNGAVIAPDTYRQKIENEADRTQLAELCNVVGAFLAYKSENAKEPAKTK